MTQYLHAFHDVSTSLYDSFGPYGEVGNLEQKPFLHDEKQGNSPQYPPKLQAQTPKLKQRLKLSDKKKNETRGDLVPTSLAA